MRRAALSIGKLSPGIEWIKRNSTVELALQVANSPSSDVVHTIVTPALSCVLISNVIKRK